MFTSFLNKKALAHMLAKASKTKTLRQSLGFFMLRPHWQPAPRLFYGALALRPSVTAGLPFSISVPNCQLKYSIFLQKIKL